ncbi:hypothetical protein VTK73DRAFT_9245 [Phialemonium thermophilum]|uniref:Cell surface protein n=1 Tax=Phialemonium thermophilum TaxID=223376 RepID=A0ABR3XLH1_9PEZI
MSSIVNKVKDALQPDKHHGNEAREGEYGPHGSRVANAADPRVDSDRDNRAHHGHGGTQTGTGGYGGGYGAGSEFGSGAGGGTYGGSTTSGYGSGGGTAGYGGGTNTGSAREGEYGPHGSRTANTLEPRVDSDRDNRAQHHHGHSAGGGVPAAGGLGSTGYGGTAGAGYGSGYDAGYGAGGGQNIGGTGGGYGAGSGPGPARNTAGPHGSDTMNKLDPRVDSDQDNRWAPGGNRTYQSGRDPTDAAQVPPSVMRQYKGDPTIEHDDHTHDRARRNSTVSHQDAFRGV